MSELISTFLTSGIRELAFLIPFFQIRESEYNVGSALTKGYLFAAATPLSISGSLGVLKQGFIFWLLGEMFPKWTFRYRRALLSRNFKFQGEVSSLLNSQDGESCCQAESRFAALISQLEISNLESVRVTHNDRHWKACAISFSLLAVICSITPYIHSIFDQRTSSRGSLATAISFPLIRALGSLLITITIQYVLRYRLLALIRKRIIFMTIGRIADSHEIQLDFLNVEWKKTGDCIQALGSYLSTDPRANEPNYQDTEMGNNTRDPWDEQTRTHARSVLSDTFDKLVRQYQQNRGPSKSRELARQFCLLIGVLFCIYGYFGCFVLIQNNSKTSIAPITWLLVELVLAATRSITWAIDHGFDEATGIELSYEQNEGHHPPSGGQFERITVDLKWDFTRKVTPAQQNKGPERGSHERKDSEESSSLEPEQLRHMDRESVATECTS